MTAKPPRRTTTERYVTFVFANQNNRVSLVEWRCPVTSYLSDEGTQVYELDAELHFLRAIHRFGMLDQTVSLLHTLVAHSDRYPTGDVKLRTVNDAPPAPSEREQELHILNEVRMGHAFQRTMTGHEVVESAVCTFPSQPE